MLKALWLLFFKLLTPGLDNTRLFMSLTAGAGTRSIGLLSSSPSLVPIPGQVLSHIHLLLPVGAQGHLSPWNHHFISEAQRRIDS